MTRPEAGTGRITLAQIAFRFCLLYFALYALLIAWVLFPLLGPLGRVFRPGLWTAALTDPITGWVGRTVFGVDAVLRLDSGAGDQAAAWVLAFCMLVAAAVATAVWSAVDRRAHPRLPAWVLLFARVLLGGQMLSFGFAKLIPTQMPAPALAQLLQPYGEFSPASVLWLQIGSSYPYEMALGAAEVAAGLLLFVPRTAVLGALASMTCMAQVLLTNLTFDIPEKLLALHLLALGTLVLAPHLRGLLDVFLRQRAWAATIPALFADRRRNRAAVWIQVALGLWIALGGGIDRWIVWHEQAGAARPKSELYGIWQVREFSLDGQPLPPLTTDENRWQRLVFDAPASATYQRMNGELVPARASFAAGGRLELATPQGTVLATLTSERTGKGRLLLHGTLRDRPVVITLEELDPNSFPLRSRGFHWVQDYPDFR
ncbi:DoxX family protein [Nocardia sp. NPDC048505]|uniref:DoxX family protein n=1 Tax=unclassified Nocardia TaxID=2637762 RepID=UPI0033CD805C